MAITDKINLDFQALDTGNPEILSIMDTSVWGFIEDKNAAIEITLPGREKTRRFNYIKNKINVFNSSNLLITPVGEIKDLADGIYRIEVFGAHGHCKHKDFLKTDKARLDLATYYVKLGISVDEWNKEEKIKIQNLEAKITAAENLAKKGELSKAIMLFKKTVEQIKDYNECNTCK